MMDKTIGQLCKEYDLDRGTLLKAAKSHRLLGKAAKQSGHIWLIDDESEQFKLWLHNHQERGQGLCNCANCKKDRASRNASSEKKTAPAKFPPRTTLRPESAISEFAAEISLDGPVISVSFPKRHDRFVEVVKSLGYAWKEEVWKRKIGPFAGIPEDRAIELGYALLANGFIVCIDESLSTRIVTGSFEPEQTRWVSKLAVGNYAGWFAIRWGKGEDYYNAARKIEDSRYNSPNVVVPPEQFEQLLDFASRYDFKLSDGAQSIAQQAREAKESMLVVKVAPIRKRSNPSDTPTAMPVPEIVEIDEDLRDG
jgi:hypothetical protein